MPTTRWHRTLDACLSLYTCFLGAETSNGAFAVQKSSLFKLISEPTITREICLFDVHDAEYDEIALQSSSRYLFFFERRMPCLEKAFERPERIPSNGVVRASEIGMLSSTRLPTAYINMSL